MICCFSDGSKSPLLGMCNFIMPLRASSLHFKDLRPVVILGDEHFLRREWSSLCNFPLVYVKLVCALLVHLLLVTLQQDCIIL